MSFRGLQNSLGNYNVVDIFLLGRSNSRALKQGRKMHLLNSREPSISQSLESFL